MQKSANEDAKKALEELQKEYENIQNALESSNQAAKDADALAKQEVDQLKESLQAAQESIQSMKDDMNAAQNELNTLKENFSSAQQEIAHLKGQIADLKSQLPDDGVEKIKIYIDQGHNPTSYHNSGSAGNGLYEQDLTYEIGVLLADLLEEDGRFEVCLSRPTANTVLGTDNDSSLDARVEGAKGFGADYFISLHTNSYTDGSANGIEVYVADQESESYTFGNSILQGLIGSTNLRNRGMKINSELRVLKNATMPAALLEMGFISNAQDAALLAESPELFAEGIFNGILNYFGLEANGASAN